MLTQEENELLCRIGPGTPAGELLRHYWHPIAPLQELAAARDIQGLIDRLQKETGRTREGVVPIAIAFPAVGPSLFLEAELTAETQAPLLDIQYHRTGGR